MIWLKMPILREFFAISNSWEDPNNLEECTEYENSIRRFQMFGPADIFSHVHWLK